MTRSSWLIVTPEYPPTPGGVSDYTRTLARELARSGDAVGIWAPAPPGGTFEADPGVNCHALPDRFGIKSRRALSRAADELGHDGIVLAQYVPHGFGARGMNLSFAAFLGGVRKRLWLMVHEALYPFEIGQPLKHRALAAVTRAMLAAATRGAERVFVSTPAWEPFLTRYGRQERPVEWLPIPATIPGPPTPEAIAAVRRELGIDSAAILVGHFGTYGRLIAEPLAETLRCLHTRHPAWRFLMLGRNARTFVRNFEELGATGAIMARDDLASSAVADHLGALDVALFPFPDGISTRRTSAMAALAVGSAIVTTRGASTEAVWARTGAVVLAPPLPAELSCSTSELVADPERQADLRRRSLALYEERFDVARVVEQLQRLA
jgi:glycosyltransferase involved in cell wall biosynthesis